MVGCQVMRKLNWLNMTTDKKASVHNDYNPLLNLNKN